MLLRFAAECKNAVIAAGALPQLVALMGRADADARRTCVLALAAVCSPYRNGVAHARDLQPSHAHGPS